MVHTQMKYIQTDRQTDKQTDRQTDRQSVTRIILAECTIMLGNVYIMLAFEIILKLHCLQ